MRDKSYGTHLILCVPLPMTASAQQNTLRSLIPIGCKLRLTSWPVHNMLVLAQFEQLWATLVMELQGTLCLQPPSPCTISH